MDLFLDPPGDEHEDDVDEVGESGSAHDEGCDEEEDVSSECSPLGDSFLWRDVTPVLIGCGGTDGVAVMVGVTSGTEGE